MDDQPGSSQSNTDVIDNPILWEPSLTVIKWAIGAQVVGSVVFFIALRLLVPNQTVRSATTAIECLIALAGWYLLSRGHVTVAVKFMALGLSVIVTAVAIFAGGVHAPLVIIYPMLILLIGWMLGVHSAAVATGLALCATAGFVVAESMGILPTPQPSPVIVYGVVQALICILALVLIHRLVTAYQNRLLDLKKTGRDLALLTENLQKSESRLRNIIENVPGAISVFDSGLRLTQHNTQFRQLLGFPQALFETPDLLFEDFIRYNAQRGEYGPGDVDQLTTAIVERARGFQPHQVERVRPNGVALEIRGTPLPGGGFVTICSDITERKRAEAALQQSARDEHALLMEIHHRVKNNLQVISSLLRMEIRRSAQEDTKVVLGDMQGRIRSMALLHETLYRSGTLASVDLREFMTRLATAAFQTQSIEPGTIQLQLRLSQVQIGVDQATPCGLLVNELISNCLKHGFPDGRAGTVTVELQALGGGPLWRLRVSDTGVGLPADFQARRKTSLGLQLVAQLSGQIGGTLEIGPANVAGAVFSVNFKPVGVGLSVVAA